MAKSYEELKASVKGTNPQKKTYEQLRDELTSKYGLTPRTDDSDFAKKYSSDLVSRANSLKSLQYDESNAESTLSRLNKEWIDISGRRHRADDYYKSNMSDADYQRYTANADNVANAYQSAIANVKSYINKQNSIGTKLNKVIENNNSQIDDIQSLYDRVAEGDSSALAELKKRNLDTVEKAETQVSNLANESAQLQRSADYYSLMENAMNQKDFDSLKDSMISMPTASGSLKGTLRLNPSAVGAYGAINTFSDEMFYTPEEKDVYRYYKAKEESGEIEEGTADKFFNLIGEQHNIREGSLVGQYLNQSPVLQYATPVAKGLFYDVPKNIANLGNLKDDYILPSSIDVASSAVRDDLGTVGKVVYDVLNTTANMIPSMAVSYVTGNPALGTGLLGAESAGSNYAEKLNSGMNKAQAYGLSLLQGVWEGASEYYLGGIETLSANKLGGLVSKSALADGIRRGTNGAVRGILRFGADMATEGLEEVIQDLGSSIIDGIVTNKWEFSSLDDLAYSFTLGALSAGALNGATNVMNRAGEYSTAKSIKADTEKVEALKKIGSTFSADSVAYKLAGKVDENTGAFTLSRMIHDLNANLSEQNQRSIEHELTERGVADSDARTISKWLAKAVDGDYFTEKEAMLLEKNPVISEVYYKTIIDDNSTVNQRLSNLATLNNEEYIRKDYSTDDAQNLEDAKKRISKYQSNTLGRDFVKADTSDIRGMADNFAKEYNGLSNIGEAVNYESRNDGKTSVISTGEEVSIKGIKSVNKNDLTLDLSNGKTVSSNDIKYSDDDTASLYGLIASQNVPTALANRLTEDFKGSKTEPVDFVLGASEAYNYGKVSYPAIPDTSLAMKLPESLRKIYYNMGKMDAITSTNVAQQKVEAKKSDATQRSGKVHMDGITNLTARQKVSLSTIARVTNDVTHNDVYIYESVTNAKGERVLKNDVGSLKKGSPAPNGMYMNGNIYLDVNAGNNGEGVMLYAFAHELTHYIKENSPAQFKKLADFVVGEMYKSGTNLQELIRAQQKKARGTMSFDDAYEEVIADSMEKLFTSTDVIERMERLKNTDKGLWDRIKSFFKKLYARVKAEYKGLDAQTREGQIVGEMKGALDKIADLFAEGVVGAGENFAKVNLQYSASTESVAPMNSLRTWEESEYTKERDNTAKLISESLDVSLEKAYKYIDDINSVARLIADDKVRLDYDPNLDETASVLKPNAEYTWTVDMSTLCAKRLLFTGTFDAIQRAFPNTAFTSEDIVRIREMMEDRNYQVACGICYVESTRREIGTITKQFIDRYKIAQEENKPITRLDGKGNEVELTVDKKPLYTEKGYTPTLADLNTTDIDKVKVEHPDVYKAYLTFMNARGQAKPKLLETRAEYNGEILSRFKKSKNGNVNSTVASLNAKGGLRLQSFSDFEIVHLMDMMQIVMDMSRVGFMSQAYTKVPAFAEAFGDTGIKINLSLIAKGDGLDENGNLIFDDVEGIDHEEAFRLRKKFSKNVGTILVGKNDAHIIKAMADDRIDYIIPFHKSSWKESLYKALGLTGYSDYTEYQNEKPIEKGRKITNFYPSDYWDPNLSGDENAKIYLEKCKEDGRIPKFPQFQQYKGYWKLLIDFKMYDNDGNFAPQEVVKPEFNNEVTTRLLNEYNGGHRTFPVAEDIVEDFSKEYSEAHKGEKFSYRGVNKDGIEVYEASEDVLKLSTKERIDLFEDMFNNEYKSRTARFTRNGHVLYATLDEGFARKTLYGEEHFDKSNNGQSKRAYIRAIADGDLFDLLEDSPYVGSAKDTKNHKAKDNFTDYFDYFVKYVQIDNDVYKLKASVKRQYGSDGAYIYTLYLRKAKNIKASPTVANHNGRLKIASNTFNQKVTHSDSKVNGKMSERDSNGKTLTSAQQEFFKDSKVRDKDGNLLVMYHGTQNEGFTVFDRSKAKSSGLYGNGFYFSDTEGISATYGKRYKVYLNIKNPLKVEDHSITSEQLRKFVEAVADNEDYGIENYGRNATVDSIVKELSGKNDFRILNDINMTCIGNFVEALEYFNEVNGTNYDGIITPTETVAFYPNQIKNIDNENPTESDDIRYSERTESTDTRTLLANALETTAQNDIERKYIAEYKQDIQKMNEAQNQLADIRSEIRELTFAKGKRDTAKIKALNEEATKIANRINVYDKKLLRLESTKPLKNVLDKERTEARKKAELAGKQMLEQYRQNAEETQNRIRQQYRERIATASENRKRNALVTKIEAVAYSLQDRLLHPSAKTVIPEAFAGAVSDFLSALDFSTFLKDGTLRSGKANMKRADMRKALERLSKSLDGRTIEDDYGQLDIAPEMIEWLEYMKNALDTAYKTDDVFVVRQMSSEDLDRLYKTIKSLQTTVNNATKFYTNATRVDKLANDTIEYLKPLQGKAHSTHLELIDKTLRWDYAQPVTVFERFGTSGDTIMKMLMKGQKVEADNLEDIRNYVETAYTEEEVRAWRDEEKTVTIGDKEYKVTTAYLMELHNLLRDPDANRHILQGGGIRFDDLENGKKVQRFSDTFISQTDADKIEKMLTPRQKEVAESLEKFMADKGAEWGNAISMVRFGYHAFGGITNYYPIKTIKAGSEYEARQKRANIYALLNKSFTKERNINANNAIIVGDIFKTFNNHMSEMALYNAWALPMIDTIKWFNYREGMDIEQGKSEVSVKESLRQAFGKNADEYIRRLLESINSQRSGGLSESLAFKSLRMVNRVAVAGNIRVAVQQPFSITRALEVVPARYLKPIVGKARQNAYDEMVKYSSFGKWKGMGYYDVDVSRPLETTILKNASVADKVTEKTMKLAEDGDAFTWANLWNACKKWMSEKYSGEELINKTAEKFDEVILKTQVVDSVLVKSQWMRSDSFFHRMTSSFMSEPMTSYNALLRRFDKLSSDSTKYGLKSAVQMSGKAVAMSTAIFILTQLVNALATAPIDAMRDDDDYETYVEKLLGNFKDNAVQNLIPTNMMPYVSDIVEYAIYGKTDRPDLQIYTKVIDLGKQISGTIENYSVPKLHNTIKSALSVGSSFSGLPVSNITRDAVSVYNTVVGNIGNGEMKFQTSADSSTVAYDKMYDAMSDGDENTMMKLYAQLKSNLVSDSSIKEGLTKRAKESYLDGDMTEDEAKKQLVDIANLVGMDSSIDDAYWTVNKWDYIGENGSTEDYSKYNDFCEAVETGKDLKNVIKTYTDNGVSKETLASQITSNFKPRYVTMTTKEKANLKGYLLNAYQLLGYDRAKKSKDIDKWK